MQLRVLTMASVLVPVLPAGPKPSGEVGMFTLVNDEAQSLNDMLVGILLNNIVESLNMLQDLVLSLNIRRFLVGLTRFLGLCLRISTLRVSIPFE